MDDSSFLHNRVRFNVIYVIYCTGVLPILRFGKSVLLKLFNSGLLPDQKMLLLARISCLRLSSRWFRGCRASAGWVLAIQNSFETVSVHTANRCGANQVGVEWGLWCGQWSGPCKTLFSISYCFLLLCSKSFPYFAATSISALIGWSSSNGITSSLDI